MAAVFAMALLAVEPDEPSVEAKAADSALAACAPKTMDEAFVCLDTRWFPAYRDAFLAQPYEDLIEYHFGLGTWMRNNWGLWSGGSLRNDMEARGIRHPDDMSQEIIESYWLEKHGCKDAPAQKAAYRAAYREALEKLPPAKRKAVGPVPPFDLPHPHLDCTKPAEGAVQ
jgi:FAD/FMN-containing dehydrogenase